MASVGFRHDGRTLWDFSTDAWPLSYLSRGVAVTAPRADRDWPTRHLQSLRQTRDDDRVPARINKSIVHTQLSFKHGPAERQHILALMRSRRVPCTDRLDFSFRYFVGDRQRAAA